MKTKEEIEIFHKENEEKYLGKETDKGVIEKIEYLTFDGLAGGNYNSRPKIGRRGLVVGCIGNKAYPIGELKFLDNVEYLREQLKEKEEEIKELKQTLTEANVLTGKQAERFEEMILNPKPITDEELKNLERANEMMQRIVKKSPGTVEYKNGQLETLIESQSKLIESLAEALESIRKRSPAVGTKNATYGNTGMDSEAVAYGFNECRELYQSIATKALTEYNNYKNKQNGNESPNF